MTRDEVCGKFLDTLEFELYPVQEEAILAWFETETGVMVSAPTGMGKTLIAEAAIYEALATGKRLYYTTPLIALTDQKYRELRAKAEKWGFSRDDVGLLTGNRKENPDAPILVVVAEILLNHLVGREDDQIDFSQVSAVVMDEFHSFNDVERGVVWELSLVLLPKHVRVMLLSATIGNPVDFIGWLKDKHGRLLRIVTSDERRVPLEFIWVEDRLMTDQLVDMASGAPDQTKSPALVFCFSRDQCWQLAETLRGLPLIPNGRRPEIEAALRPYAEDLALGVGPKLQQMLIRGVGVHHAGVLPRHKIIVEDLFERRLVPFVICTETLAAGINLPARSVVFSTLLKGKPRERKVVPASQAHQMFGRAGRPQFDTQGYVVAIAHDDDVKINKWKQRYDQIDPKSKDPGIMRARKDMERKRPSRRKTEQYWTEGQFQSLIKAGPGPLQSRSMIPYRVLIYLLTKNGTLHEAREFVSKRFAPPPQIEAFQKQLDAMIGNLAALDYLTRAEDGDHVTLHDTIEGLLVFRSIDPLYGAFLAEELTYSNFEEKLQALESVLESPPRIARLAAVPHTVEPGPLQTQRLEPLLTQKGLLGSGVETKEEDDEDEEWWAEEETHPPRFPEMLKLLFDTKLAAPEDVFVQPKWIAGGVIERDCDFFGFVKAAGLVKQEGLILRHLLRLIIMAGEFDERTGDPEYRRISELATQACQQVDPAYTDKFLAEAIAMREAQ